MSSQMTEALYRGGSKCQRMVHSASIIVQWDRGISHLCVLYYEVARGEGEGDEGGGEEHLDDGRVALIAAEDAGEGVGVVDAEALGGRCRRMVSWLFREKL